jgi:hypothetical protein
VPPWVKICLRTWPRWVPVFKLTSLTDRHLRWCASCSIYFHLQTCCRRLILFLIFQRILRQGWFEASVNFYPFCVYGPFCIFVGGIDRLSLTYLGLKGFVLVWGINRDISSQWLRMSTRDIHCGLFFLANAPNRRTVKTDFRTCITDIASSISFHETDTVVKNDSRWLKKHMLDPTVIKRNSFKNDYRMFDASV